MQSCIMDGGKRNCVFSVKPKPYLVSIFVIPLISPSIFGPLPYLAYLSVHQ